MRSRPKRVGGRCEPTGEPCRTGPGVACLSPLGEVGQDGPSRYRGCSLQEELLRAAERSAAESGWYSVLCAPDRVAVRGVLL